MLIYVSGGIDASQKAIAVILFIRLLSVFAYRFYFDQNGGFHNAHNVTNERGFRLSVCYISLIEYSYLKIIKHMI